MQSVASETFSAVAAPVQYAAIRAYQGRLDARNNNDDSVASYLNRYHEDRCTLRNQTNSQQLATLKEACIDFLLHSILCSRQAAVLEFVGNYCTDSMREAGARVHRPEGKYRMLSFDAQIGVFP